MAEPVHRASFMGADIFTQALTIDGQPLFFVDVTAPDDRDHVSIGWNATRTKFGVYVNGVCVHPPDNIMDPSEDLITDTEPGA